MSKLIILSTGLGSRCYPLTNHYCKSLLPIESVVDSTKTTIPLLQHQLNLIIDGYFNISSVILACNKKDQEKLESIVSSYDVPYTTEVFELNEYNNSYTMKRLAQKYGLEDSYVLEPDVAWSYHIYSKDAWTESSHIFTCYREHEWRLKSDYFSSNVYELEKDGTGYCMFGFSYIAKSDAWLVESSLEKDTQYEKYWDEHFISSVPEIKVHELNYLSVREFDTVDDYFESGYEIRNYDLLASHISDNNECVRLGGLSNRNYLIRMNNELTILQFITEYDNENRWNNIQLYESYNPDSIKYSQYGKYIRTCKYLSNTRLLKTKSDIHRVVKYLHSISTNPVFPKLGEYIFLNIIKSNLTEWEIDEDIIQYVLEEFQLAIKITNPVFQICHADLVPRNILIDKFTKRIQLIDYEYAGVYHDYWEIAGLLSEYVIEYYYHDSRAISVLLKLIKDISNKYSYDYDSLLLWSTLINLYWSLWKSPQYDRDSIDYLKYRLYLSQKLGEEYEKKE